MILLIGLILVIWGIAGLCSDYDHEDERIRDYRRAERRHKENLEVMERQLSTLRKQVEVEKRRRKVTRTVAKDEHGRVVAQETVESYEED